MAYTEESVLTSKRAYQIYRFLHIHPREDSYPTEIGNQLQIDRSVVGEIMSVLLRLGLIKRGERTKAQFYHVNLDLFDLWKLLWTKEIEEGTEDVETYDDLIKEALQEGLDEGYDEISGKFSDFLSLYISNYLEEYEESTIREMMVGDFLQGALIFEKELDPPEKGNFSWFFGITHILENLYQEGYRRGYEPTKEALEEISGR